MDPEDAPPFERFRERVVHAYEDYGRAITGWANEARRGRPLDVLEMNRRYALARDAMERELAAAVGRLRSWKA